MNFQQRISGTSDPSNFHDVSFVTPASIVHQTQVEHIDIANDAGGALAVYYTYDGDGDPFSIRAQVCMEDRLATILPFAGSILKEEMKKVNNFYDFIKNYSPCDYKVIQNKPYISQRVISTHVEIWNQINDVKIKHLQVFFI